MRAFALLSLLLLAACPEQVGSQCPPHTVALGEYTLNRIGSSDPGQCVATQADGGGATPLTLADAGQVGGTVCLGSSDGGPQLQLVIAGKETRPSGLLADGGFHFTGHSDPVSGTLCGCAVAVDESLDGFLTTTPPGPVAIQADGGLPPITGLSGTLTDVLSTDAGTAGCLCTLPCPVIYSLSGTRF